jgi:hypothetical protein
MDMIIHVDDCNNDYSIFCEIFFQRNMKHIEEDHTTKASHIVMLQENTTTIERLSREACHHPMLLNVMFIFIHNLRNGDFCHA